MRTPLNTHPFYHHPDPDLPWSVGIEPIRADEKWRMEWGGPETLPLPPITDPLGLAHKVKSDSPMQALLLVTQGEHALYEERIIHPGGVTDIREGNENGDDYVAMLLAHAVRRTIEHYGLDPSKLFVRDIDLAFMLEIYLADLDVPVEWEEKDPHYFDVAYRRRRFYSLEATTHYPFALPSEWMALGLDEDNLCNLFNELADCYNAVADCGFKDSTASLHLSGIPGYESTLFMLTKPNMREPVSFTFVQDIKDWSMMESNFLSSEWDTEPAVYRNVSAQPMIPEYTIYSLVIHISFWPRNEEWAADVVKEFDDQMWPVAADAYPKIWIANSAYGTLSDQQCDDLLLQLSAVTAALRAERKPLRLNNDMEYHDQTTDILVTGTFTTPVEYWEPKEPE